MGAYGERLGAWVRSAAGSKRGADDGEIAYRFAASPNRTNIVIGRITVASKKCWEYL